MFLHQLSCNIFIYMCIICIYICVFVSMSMRKILSNNI